MKDEAQDLAAARVAKEKAKQIFPRYGSVNGVGLTWREGHYAVKVNFESEPADRERMPEEVDGVPVVVQIGGPLHKQASHSR
jgi:hypothetical protein